MEGYIIYFTAILASLGTLKYAYESIKGEVKPNRVSQFFWGLLPFIGFVIALQKGSTFTENLPLFVAWFFNFTVFLISIFNKKAYFKIGIEDMVCALFASLAIFFWLFLDNPFYALCFAILGDVLAGLPTLWKCYKYSETESISSYALSLPNLLLGLFILPNFTFYTAGYTFWLLVSNTLKTFLILRKHFKRVFL